MSTSEPMTVEKTVSSSFDSTECLKSARKTEAKRSCKSIVAATISADGTHIVSLIESRGAASEVGIALFNLATSVCILSQFADTSGYSKTLHLLTLYPAEVVIVSSSAVSDSSPSKLYLTIQELVKDIDLAQVPR